MRYIEGLSDEARDIADHHAWFLPGLSEWQQNWINQWVAAGRPKGLYAQYVLATRSPVRG